MYLLVNLPWNKNWMNKAQYYYLKFNWISSMRKFTGFGPVFTHPDLHFGDLRRMTRCVSQSIKLHEVFLCVHWRGELVPPSDHRGTGFCPRVTLISLQAQVQIQIHWVFKSLGLLSVTVPCGHHNFTLIVPNLWCSHIKLYIMKIKGEIR